MMCKLEESDGIREPTPFSSRMIANLRAQFAAINVAVKEHPILQHLRERFLA